MKIHSSCEIEDFVETHLCKLCVILRSRALRVAIVAKILCTKYLRNGRLLCPTMITSDDDVRFNLCQRQSVYKVDRVLFVDELASSIKEDIPEKVRC